MERNRRKGLDPRIQYVIFGVIAACFPLLAQAGLVKNSVITLLGGVLIYAIVGFGYDILLGYSGLLSLGTAGFMGLAAYLSAYLVEDMGFPFSVSLIISVAIPVLLSLVVGLISLRIEGIYLAIATLIVSEILRKTFEELVWFTNAFSGKKGSYPVLFGSLKLDRSSTFWMLVILVVLLMILSYHLINSRQGRALHAMRGSEVAAQAMGVNLLKYRLLAFALSSACAALGGVMYMHFINFAYPSTWNLMLSLNILAVVVIGGQRSVWGTLIGAFIVYAFPDLVLKKLPVIGDVNGLSYIFTGVLIVVIILLYPKGLVHVGDDLKRLFAKRKAVK